MSRWITGLAAAALLAGAATAAQDNGTSILESAVCANAEETRIDRFRSIATPWLNDLRSLRPQVREGILVEPYRIKNAIDERTLLVYKLTRATAGQDPMPPKRLLFVQGNAMFAGSVADHLEPFVDAGFEVHMMEFRGYGFSGLRSEGKAFLQAVVSDFRQLAAQLSNGPPLYLYGISFGGIVVMNILSQPIPVAAAAVDSTPSDLTCPMDYGCDSRWWPIRNVPAGAAHVIAISGTDDPVVPTTCSDALLQAVRDRGGCTVTGARWTHPLFGERRQHRDRRTQILLAFLTSGQCPKEP